MEVRVESLRKEFGRFPALVDVTLDILSGELIALLGPSGSGKTTLLRLIAGLESPTEGMIFFGDEDASKRTVQERNIGFVFQHYALFRHMTVLDNVTFGLKVRPANRRPPAAEIRRRALDLIDLVQLSGLEKRYPAQLSGGPAAAGGARPRYGGRTERAAARRALRRARRAGSQGTSPVAPRNPRPHRVHDPLRHP
ncbi:ATP-binding cassette domain-containing protein (plasmid) [Sinorhizobium meliloti]|nr:ATP-binding cassette domain-containing protein [Sinorhizobium meliloti]